MILDKKFYSQDTITVAKSLLGKYLVCENDQGKTVGKIVETEAYLHKIDQASHSFNGKTKRNLQMFDSAGTAYIYLIYGMYNCFNVVTNKKDVGEAVLIRALEPVYNIELMQKRRKTKNLHNLCSGPGKLTIAMGISRKDDGLSLISKSIYIKADNPQKLPDDQIVCAPRVGIAKQKDSLLRFYVKNNNFISKK